MSRKTGSTPRGIYVRKVKSWLSDLLRELRPFTYRDSQFGCVVSEYFFSEKRHGEDYDEEVEKELLDEVRLFLLFRKCSLECRSFVYSEFS